MRRAAMPAMAEVARRLGVDADWIVFGHVHRLGSARRDRAWQPGPTAPRLLNTGAWVFEPMLLDRAAPPHPYWPGGAVLLEPGAATRGRSGCSTTSRREHAAPADSRSGRSAAGSGGCRRTRARGSRGRAPRRRSARAASAPAIASSIMQVRGLGLVPAGDQPVDGPDASVGVDHEVVQPDPARPRRRRRRPSRARGRRSCRPRSPARRRPVVAAISARGVRRGPR